MNIIRLDELVAQGKLAGRRVFIRADLNVPQDDAGHITEDTRIRASVPCIQTALTAGAAVMVTSHLGRPTEGQFKPEDSLAPVAQRLGELLGREVRLVSNWVDGVQVNPGQVVLLENCRLNPGEKKNSESLARKMAALCDIFVNDAFGTAHRAHASTEGVTKYLKTAVAGFLLQKELDYLVRGVQGRGKLCCPFLALPTSLVGHASTPAETPPPSSLCPCLHPRTAPCPSRCARLRPSWAAPRSAPRLA